MVRWDQRGAGLSYSKTIPKDTFTIDTFVSDLNEVTDYLRNRFEQSKIILAGHSWGTVIATYAAREYPNKYSTYIGIGQLVDSQEGEKIAYHYTKSEAMKQSNKKVLKKLEEIGEPPYSQKEMMTRVNCQARIGGVVKTEPPRSLLSSLLSATEYDLKHKLGYQKACMESAQIMYSHIMKINFIEEIKCLEVPTIFIMGQYDYITPITLVKTFYEGLEAPKKDFIVMENSAHIPQLEESERFADILIGLKR